MNIEVDGISYDLADLPEDVLKDLGIPVEEYDPFARLFPGMKLHSLDIAPIVSEADASLGRRELSQLWRIAVADKKRRWAPLTRSVLPAQVEALAASEDPTSTAPSNVSVPRRNRTPAQVPVAGKTAPEQSGIVRPILGSSLAMADAIINAEIQAYGEVNGGPVLTPGQAVSIGQTRAEINNSLSPYAVAHGVELALQNLGVGGITSLPPTNKNFTTITAEQYSLIKSSPGINVEHDYASHGISSGSIDLGDGYALKFYGQSDGNYFAAIIHKTKSIKHVLIDFPEYWLGSEEVNGSIAEAYGGFATVDAAFLKQLEVIANSSAAAATAFDDFNTKYPNQYFGRPAN